MGFRAASPGQVSLSEKNLSAIGLVVTICSRPSGLNESREVKGESTSVQERFSFTLRPGF